MIELVVILSSIAIAPIGIVLLVAYLTDWSNES